MHRGPDRPLIAVSLGDPGGIGPEVVLKAWADETIQQEVRLLLVGAAHVVHGHAKALGHPLPPVEIIEAVPGASPDDRGGEGTLYVLDVAEGHVPAASFGTVTEAGGALSMRSVERAVDLCRTGAADAMVTAPISKAAIARAGYHAPGHTEFIAARTGGSEPLMLMVGTPAGEDGEALRVGLVSVHEPLRAVPRSVTADAIQRKLRILAESLSMDFGIEVPRIAVLGLNPHAGEGGALGHEEEQVFRPALEAARTTEGPLGGRAEIGGPFPADGFFGTRRWAHYDAVLAAYHDQGLVPFKALTFGGGVNMTAGLEVVRTSPDHGTAFDIAGTGRADPGSMKSALRLAAAVARRRQRAGSRRPAAREEPAAQEQGRR